MITYYCSQLWKACVYTYWYAQICKPVQFFMNKQVLSCSQTLGSILGDKIQSINVRSWKSVKSHTVKFFLIVIVVHFLKKHISDMNAVVTLTALFSQNAEC